jgi:hypothetical protein
MILVAMNYANNILSTKMAENEFSSNKQFMHTTGIQMDDIAWTIGRTQTVSFSTKFGTVKFQELLLNYTFRVHTSSGWENLTVNGATGIILFNMPVRTYSLGNNYFERVPTSADGSFLQNGSSAPASQVFCEEKLPMHDGSYIRIAVVPTIRMLESNIKTSQQTSTNYFKFYLPTLETGARLYGSQSITMTGNGITKVTRSGVDQVIINVAFPNATSLGFDSSFFNFENISELKQLPSGSVVEFYIGKVQVTFG